MKTFRNINNPPPLAAEISDQAAAIYIIAMTKELMEIARSRHMNGLADMLAEPYQTAFAILSADEIPAKALRSEISGLR